jgi:SynChlorMet cassette protein ScmC
MEQVAAAIAARSLARGGILLHGALAVRDGAGFVLAGPSGIGKSTASRRLPLPWLPLSDDCALVLRDVSGRYWAHPWPTWSRLRDQGPIASWPVEQAVPLKALLFLTQSSFDRAEPVTATPAAAFIMESAYHLARVVAFTPDGDANRTTCAKYLRAARDLAAAVPALRLHISLNGRFWDEIERTVSVKPRMDTDGHGCGLRRNQNSDTRNQNAE